ncbi:Rgg/GadR/MutR family transcriptional activator [Streptococcus equinus]|nr:Rgg/GadR/MutR family transcriptional activator [Streptococcus equinus]
MVTVLFFMGKGYNMENHLGKCFNLLRESKGLSQKEIAGEVISIAQLSRFERGVSNINTDTLYHCLENMNVSIAEFQCVCLNYSQNQRLLFQDEVAKAYLEKNILTLKHYLVKCNQQEQVAKTDVQFLVDHLFSVDEWGRYEGGHYYAFDSTETVDGVTKKVTN